MKDEKRKESLKKTLLEKKRKLWGDLRDDLFRKLGKDYNTQFDIPNDLEDLSVIDHIEDLGLTVSDMRKEELVRIDESLRKLDQGTYGKCERCGVEIEEERLRIDPNAQHCVRCQRELEGGAGKKPTL